MDQPSSPIPPFSHSPTLVVLHRLPTRLRLSLPGLGNGTVAPLEAEIFKQPHTKLLLTSLIEEGVGTIEGVTAVRANLVLGTLLIEHDGAPAREATILEALGTLLPPVSPALTAPHLLTSLAQLGGVLNRTVFHTSRGWLDLKTTIPLLLGAYGFGLLLTERPVRSPSSLTLLWWAYTSLRVLAREMRG
jgi:hypothetical protein